MISQLIKTSIITKCLLRFNSLRFSTNPTPNREPRNNENKPQVKIQNMGKLFEQDSKSSDSILRSQARLRVSRAELAKYARIELDYEKVNNHSEKLEKVTKYLKNNDFKIKTHPDHGARLQFYRTQQVTKKKSKQKQPSQSQDQKKDKKQQQEFQEQLEMEDEQIQLEVKIFTSAVKEFDRKEVDYMDGLFDQQDLQSDPLSSLVEKMGMKGDKTINQALNKHKQLMKKLHVNLDLQKKIEQDGSSENLIDQDKFKEFSVYLRNTKNRGVNQDKWMKIDIFMQDFNQIHLCNVSVINNIQNELKGIPPPKNLYQSIEAKNLDPSALKLLHQFLVHAQQLTPEILTGVYYYTIHYESLIYRKWLEDLIDITK